MDLNGLTLSPSQVAQWYAKTLVDVPGGRVRARAVPAPAVTDAPAPAVTAAPAPLKFLGENGQHILILVRDTSAVFLEEKSFQFLLSVLEACKLSMASVALVNLATETTRRPEDIATELGSVQVILFGVEISEWGLPMVFPTYQVQPYGNRTYLVADALSTISAERTLKGRLWACLKTMFQR